MFGSIFLLVFSFRTRKSFWFFKIFLIYLNVFGCSYDQNERFFSRNSIYCVLTVSNTKHNWTKSNMRTNTGLSTTRLLLSHSQWWPHESHTGIRGNCVCMYYENRTKSTDIWWSVTFLHNKSSTLFKSLIIDLSTVHIIIDSIRILFLP